MTVYQRLSKHGNFSTYRFLEDSRLHYAVGLIHENLLLLRYVDRKYMSILADQYNKEITEYNTTPYDTMIMVADRIIRL